MSFLRNLLADLVEKRLWPVAVVLAGALVAVPFLLGGGGDAGDADVPPIPATQGAVAKATEIRVSEETSVATITPTGSRHNPFKQPKAKQAQTTPEQAPVPGPPTPTCASAAWIARPMSTEQLTGASPASLPRALSVIRAAPGSLR